jgi:hypothetical protein
MKRIIPVVSTALALVLVLLLSFGCAPSVALVDFNKTQADLTATKADLTAAKAELAKLQDQFKTLQGQTSMLSAIAAYTLWYDQYYTYWYSGYTNYQFADATSFQNNFGNLIKGTSNAATLKAWEDYLTSYQSYDAVLKSLPKDNKTWDKGQTDKWTQAYNATYAALGKVGTPLYEVIVKK